MTYEDGHCDLIEVAEAINTARQYCNVNELTAPQNGVYGKLSEALIETLRLHFKQNFPFMLDSWNYNCAERVYAQVIDNGESVSYNLTQFLKNEIGQ